MRFAKLTILTIGLSLLTAAAGPLLAQEWAGRGRLQGVVTDEAGEPIEGAKITLIMADHQSGPDSFFTNKKGRWSYLGLAGGLWAITIEYEGKVPSEGTVKVNEFGRAETIKVELRDIPEEELIDERAAVAVKLLDEGNALLKANDYAAARAKYEEALDNLEPEHHAMVWEGISRTYLGEGNGAQAVAVLDGALAESPGNPALLRAKAQAHYQNGEVDESIDTLEKLHAADPSDVQTLQLLIDLLVRENREEEANAYMAKLPEGAKVNPDTLLNTGINFYNEGKLEEALEQFDRAVEENPDLADAYYYRGLVHLGMQNNEPAIADLEKLLEMAPDHPRAAEAQEFLDYLKAN